MTWPFHEFDEHPGIPGECRLCPFGRDVAIHRPPALVEDVRMDGGRVLADVRMVPEAVKLIRWLAVHTGEAEKLNVARSYTPNEQARWSFNVGLLVGGLLALVLGFGLGALLVVLNGGPRW